MVISSRKVVGLVSRILYLPDQYSQQRQRQKKVWIYPVRLAMEATYMLQAGHDVTWDRYRGDYDFVVTEPKGLNFLTLPAPDRIFTRALDSKYQTYGNYKYHPATHMQVADGCWHGKCTFCVENGRGYAVRDLGDIQQEIWNCHELGFKEIFDDSGTFPEGKWLEKFCYLVSLPIKFGCNMRIGADADFKLMKQAGFRMVLFGIESANQSTLDRIKKGIKAYDIIPTIKRANDAGLEAHVAIICGFPWETAEEENETIQLVHYLLRKGYAKTAQASLFDVQGESALDRKSVSHIYSVAFYPEFWYHKIFDIKGWNDFKYLLKSIRKGILHD
jgi:anaerobic magnesium-protoporphyrin IX monomethyl ester cyclase